MLTISQQQVNEGIDAVIVDSVLKIRNGLTKSAKTADPSSFSAATSGSALLPVVDGVGNEIVGERIHTPVPQ